LLEVAFGVYNKLYIPAELSRRYDLIRVNDMESPGGWSVVDFAVHTKSSSSHKDRRIAIIGSPTPHAASFERDSAMLCFEPITRVLEATIVQHTSFLADVQLLNFVPSQVTY
jgi:hypothetical protein